MATYHVTLSYNVVASKTATVEADSKEEALDKAIKETEKMDIEVCDEPPHDHFDNNYIRKI